ncbi:NAD(P)-dependent oxidoreductase, partial [Klebsiella pneumoniae]|uniref:NAD(P)-dependent oxidoreductase n=1 Tax=Klebsiella pneumoniae TaxID=573 RepID=UPI0027BA8A47
VMIVNTSRGALIDSQAAIEALKNQKIGSLGMDVYENERDLFFEDKSNDVIQDVMIVNTSRGALIDSQAAIEALKNQKIGSLGMDV